MSPKRIYHTTNTHLPIVLITLLVMKNMFKDEDYSEDEFFYIDKQGKPVEVE